MTESEIKIYMMPVRDAAAAGEAYCRSHFPERYERALRFRFEADRLRSIAAGCLIHRVLGLEEAELRTGENGKPYAEKGPPFSLSHSGDYTILAVAYGPAGPVGVDIEKPVAGHLDLAEEVFAGEELRWMNGEPESRFWVLWTMKEALLKAAGKGLGEALKEICVLPLIEGEALEYCNTTWRGCSRTHDGHVISLVYADDAAGSIRFTVMRGAC